MSMPSRMLVRPASSAANVVPFAASAASTLSSNARAKPAASSAEKKPRSTCRPVAANAAAASAMAPTRGER